MYTHMKIQLTYALSFATYTPGSQSGVVVVLCYVCSDVLTPNSGVQLVFFRAVYLGYECYELSVCFVG